ncbi:MAG: AI-2E family transporter [Actinomycetota bacterium]
MYFRVADWLKAIIFAVVILTIYLFIGDISHTLIIFALSAIIVFLINPIVTFLTKRKISRSAAILITFFLIFGLIDLVILLAGPFIIEQFTNFLQALPALISSLRNIAKAIENFLMDLRLGRIINMQPNDLIDELSRLLLAQGRRLLTLIPSVVGLITDVFLLIIVSLYLIIYLPTIDKSLADRLPDDLKDVYRDFLASMKANFTRYLLGLLAVMFTIGTLAGIGLWIIGLPFPALLGLWAGLTEIIPIVGPILGAIPAIIVALTIKPILALWVIVVFIIVQLTENYFLSPHLLGGAVRLNPILILFAIIAGGEIAGIIGVFLSVPVLVILSSIAKFLSDNFSYEREEQGPDRIVVKK